MKVINAIRFFHYRIAPLMGVIILFCMLTGCSFQVGIDWNGKTDKSFVTESPNYRVTKATGKY